MASEVTSQGAWRGTTKATCSAISTATSSAISRATTTASCRVLCRVTSTVPSRGPCRATSRGPSRSPCLAAVHISVQLPSRNTQQVTTKPTCGASWRGTRRALGCAVTRLPGRVTWRMVARVRGYGPGIRDCGPRGLGILAWRLSTARAVLLCSGCRRTACSLPGAPPDGHCVGIIMSFCYLRYGRPAC